MIRYLFLFIGLTTILQGKNIAVISNCSPKTAEILRPLNDQKNITIFSYSQACQQPDKVTNHDIVVWFEKKEKQFVPKHRRFLFQWEPGGVNPIAFYAKDFNKVFTWHSLLVDNKKMFKLYYPSKREMVNNIPSFYNKKKFALIVNSHWSEPRKDVVRYFLQHYPEKLDIYGRIVAKEFKNLKMNKGIIYGTHLGPEKLNLMKEYKFCICFENNFAMPGYVSEKIFACLAAGCIPVYLGAPDIYDFVDSDCFIDFKNFESLDEMYLYLSNMDESTYNTYQAAIRRYLKSEKSHKFSIENYLNILNSL